MVIRGIFYHACAWTAVEIATVHSHPGDTHGKREGHMRDTFQGRDTNFFGMPTPVFGTGVGTEKVSPWIFPGGPDPVPILSRGFPLENWHTWGPRSCNVYIPLRIGIPGGPDLGAAIALLLVLIV